MKKILLLNYYFPPAGGPAVQRWLSIVKHLIGHDVVAHVVAPDPTQATYAMYDEKLLSSIPESVKVHHTPTQGFFNVYKKYIGKGKIPSINMADEPDPTALQKIARFVRGNFFLPDPRRGWNPYAYDTARKVIEQEKIDLVITAGPPHSTHLVGLKLKQELGIKWVADLHDYWTEISNLDKFYRTSLANWIDKQYERNTLEQADLVLTHCQWSKKILLGKTNSITPSKIHVHTMGFDEDLFTPRKQKPQSSFVITYTGVMPDFYHPECLFEALAASVKEYANFPLVIRFVGVISPKIKEKINALGLGECFEEIGYVSHTEAIEYLYESTMLFLINPLFKHEKMHVPGKIYEYLAVRKPILCFGPTDGENASLILASEAGANFEREDIEGASEYLKSMFKAWLVSKNIDLQHDNSTYLNYGRAKETAQLAHVLKSVGK